MICVRNDLYPIDWRIHVILTNKATSRPSEPKFTVIKAQKKLKTINAGGGGVACLPLLSGFLSVPIATNTLLELFLPVVN